MKTKQRFTCPFIIAMLLLACSVSQGQQWYSYAPPPTEFDWQLFAPVTEIDMDSDEISPVSKGYFFELKRMKFWMSRPNTAPVGNAVGVNPIPVYVPNEIQYAYVTPTNFVNPILQATADGGSFGFQFNGIADATPSSATGWGNRFDLGWIGSDARHGSGSTGWSLSVLTGLDMNRQYLYGFDDKRLNQLGAAQGLDGIDAVPAQAIGSVPIAPVAPVAGINAIPHADGLTTVQMAFNDPFNLLLGFVDINADQLPDDLNGVAGIQFGAFPGGDQLRLGVVFDDVTVNNVTKISGVELLAMRRKTALHNGAIAEMFLGARFLDVDDRFGVVARGGVLADSEWRNRALNRIVGPEFGIRIAQRTRRLSTVISGRFLAGANMMSLRQKGVLGSHVGTVGTLSGGTAPGLAVGFGGSEFANVLRDERFSPTGEFRFEGGLHVTKGVSLTAAWEGMVVGGIARSANTIDYTLPTLGLLNRSEDIFTHGITFGIEVNR